MNYSGWGTRHRNPRPRSTWALFALVLRIVAVAAVGAIALPAAATAQDQPGTERLGSVYGNPGYTWDVIIDNAGTSIVTIIGPVTSGTAPVWASFGGGSWYYTNMLSQYGGTIWAVVDDPSQLPSFLDPSDPNYPLFVNQLLPPQPLPDLIPPPNTPPTLQQDDPGDDPGFATSTDYGSDDTGDIYWGDGSGPDPGSGGCGGDIFCLDD